MRSRISHSARPLRLPSCLWAFVVGISVVSLGWWTGVAKAALADDVALALEHAVNGLKGTEVQGAMSGSVLGADLSVTLKGVAFCLPPNPAAEPNPNPTPPDNAYGCSNAAQVSVNLLPDTTGGEATIHLNVLFIDLTTTRDRTLYCGELGSGSVTGTGYALTNCTIHAGFELFRQNGCLQARLGTVSSDLGSVAWVFSDHCLSTWAPIVQLMRSLIDANIDPYFSQMLEVVFADANPELCTRTMPIGWCNLQWPPSLSLTVGTASDPVFGQVWIDGVTSQPGATTALAAEFGYGPDGSDPGVWQWSPAVYSLDVGNNDEFMATIMAPAPGAYDYAYRYSYNSGPWVYGDLDGSMNGYSPGQAGSLTVTGAAGLPGVIPTRLHLYPSRPNPFTPPITILFDLAKAGSARLVVYDVAGRLVRALVDADLPAGSHTVAWDGRDTAGHAVGPGGYVARLESGGMVETVRMALVR
jgi:flagellar hook capping protein FlgD